jgi:hypothetical protein
VGATTKRQRERERRRAPVHERITPAAEVVGVDDASERLARRWSAASAPTLPAYAPRGCLCCAAGAACGRHPPTRPHGEPLPSDVRAHHAPRFGAALDDVRIDRSPAAAADAAALGARAFTIGADIAFASGRFEPSTPTGLRLLTHELVHASWHRDGRLRRDVDPAGVRERTSTSSGTDAIPLVGVTAHDWISIHGASLVSAVRAALTNVALPLNVPELGWLTDQAAFLDAALRPLTGLGNATVWSFLPAYLRPDSLTDAVNIGRDCHPELTGTPVWVSGVTDEVVRRLTLRLVESIGRMARVVARHLTRDWRPDVVVSTTATGTSSAPLLAWPGAVTLGPTAAGVAFGHPIDPYVYGALRARTRVNAPAYRAAHPDEFTADAIARESRPLRPVRYQSLASRGLPSWIRVTEPADATVEEVAQTLYGETTAAYRLTAAPPMFGLPRADIVAADFRNSLWPAGPPSSTEPAEWQPRLAFAEGLRLVSALDDAHVSTSSAGTLSPELELLTGAGADPAMVDAIALRAAARIMPTPGASRELIRERMAYIANQLAAMLPNARALARPPNAPSLTITFTGRGFQSQPYVAPESIAMANRLTAARTRVVDRLLRLSVGPASDALDWDGHSRGQLEIVTACSNGLVNAQVLAAQYQGWPVIHQLIVEIADAYVGAAEVSDLYPSARARLDAAERRSILFPVTAMELLLASLRAALDEARTSEMTDVTVNPGQLYGVNDMDREEAGLRTRLANLRGLLLSDPRAAAIELRAVLDAINSLQTGVSLALNLDTCDRVWQALHSSTSVMGEFRALWGGGNAILRRGQDASNRLSREWFDIMLEWRYGDRARARERLRVKAQGAEWRGWVSDMAAAIRDHQTIDRLMTFAAMVGIAVLSFGIGAYVEAAAGAAWGVTAGVTSVASVGATAVGVLAEATVFTGLSYPLTTNNPTLGGLGESFVTNLAFIGGGRALAHGIGSLVTVDRAALEAGSITLDQFRRAERLRAVLSSSGAIVGMGAANLVLAERQSQRERGHGLSSGERASLTLENAAFVAATMLATALLRRPLLALRLEGEFAVLRGQHDTSLRALERTLAEFETTPSPEAGLRQRLIADVQRAVRSEQRLVDRLRQVVETADARGAAGAHGEARTMLRTAGITDALAAELRSGSLRSDVLARVSAMQAMRIANALQPVGSDYAIPSAMYGEAEAFYRSSPNTRVVAFDDPFAFLAEGEPLRLEPRAGDLPAGELPPARIEPGGRSFLVMVEGERPFRVYERRTGAVGELAGRVELAATPEAAAAARDPMARPASGGRAGANEIQWGMPAEAIEGVRRALLERADVGSVERAMRAASVDATREQLEAVKRYLFDSRGIAFDRANVEAWNRLASGRGQIRDVAFLVHELAEIRAFEAERRRSGFDYRGVEVDRLSATERQRWDADFNRHYLAAHSEALAAEYAYVARAVAEATNGRVRIGRNIAAAVDPTRAEARANMLVDGRPLAEHADFATWTARGAETVEIGAGAAERLRLRTRTPTLADLIAAVKGGGADPRGAVGRGGFTSLVAPSGDPTASAGRSGASDARVDTWLTTLDPRRAARLGTTGHVAALHGAPAVVDFLVRPGETNVGALEAWVNNSRLAPGEAIAILNDVLTRRGTLTSDQVNAIARALRGDFHPPASRPTSRADLVRAAGLLATEPRYAANPARAVEDLRALVGDNVELPVAIGELSRGSGGLILGDSTIAGAGALGPDITLAVPGTATVVGRELVATTPVITPDVTPAVALENALVNNLSGKFVDYARPAVTATVREIAVQVRQPVTGENLDALMTADFLNRVVERTRNTSSVYDAGLHNSISQITFYNSHGQRVHTWTPAAPP